MKFLKYIFALVLIAGTFAACDTTQDPATYKSTDYVKFSTMNNSITAYVRQDGDVFNVEVNALKTSGSDRSYSFTVVDSLTTADANDYSIASNTVTVPADSVFGYIPITLNKSNLDGSEVITIALTGETASPIGVSTLTVNLSEFCEFNRDALLGVYAVEEDALFEDVGYQFELIAGDAPNEIIMVAPFMNGVNMVMSTDVSDYTNFTVSVAPQLGWVSGTYGDVTVAGSGTFSQCNASFSLSLEHVVSAGTYGYRAYVFSKVD